MVSCLNVASDTAPSVRDKAQKALGRAHRFLTAIPNHACEAEEILEVGVVVFGPDPFEDVQEEQSLADGRKEAIYATALAWYLLEGASYERDAEDIMAVGKRIFGPDDFFNATGLLVQS
ncbi:hypothetical protein BJ546DRAFT_1069776 [Cryomyces antarcticus]